MPKDPTRNIENYQIRGGQLNAFEFHQNQGAVSEQQKEHDNWMGAPEGETDLPPDKAKAERIRRLLAKHGESVPKTEERQPQEYEMEEGWTEEQRDTPQTQMASEPSAAKDEDRWNEVEASEKDFAPTHGRSPEVIKEMIQSRRATDRVPDPEDITAGRTAQSKERKEHGEAGPGTATRRTNEMTASAQSANSTKGKEAAVDRSKPGVAKGASAKKEDEQSTARKSAKQASARQSGKQAATTRGAKKAATPSAGRQTTSRKSAKQTATSKGEKQTIGRKSATKASARNGTKSAQSRSTKQSKAVSTRSTASNGTGTKSARSRPAGNGKATTRTAKSARTAAPTRSKSSAGRSR